MESKGAGVEEAEVVESYQELVPNEQLDTGQGRHRRNKLIAITVVAVALIALVIVGIALTSRSANRPTGGAGSQGEPSATAPIGTPGASGNYTGEGFAVVVVDSGVNKNHVALQGKVIEEICVGFTEGYVDAYGQQPVSMCPEGAQVVAQKDHIRIYRGEGAASDCTPRLPETAENQFDQPCIHGTSMAGIIAMDPQTIHPAVGEINLAGSAPGAKIIAVQAYSYIPAVGRNPAMISPDNELSIAALEYIADSSGSFGVPIASVNYSIGVEEYSAGSDAECRAIIESVPGIAGQYEGYKQAFSRLKNLGIATVVANGNAGVAVDQYMQVQLNSVEFPACVDGAIAVGAVDDTMRNLAVYSQNGPNTALLAPGGDGSIDTLKSVWFPAGYSNTEFRGWGGTSEAAPYVAGAFAVLRQKYPQASVSQLLRLFEETGVPVNDTREGFTVGAKPLIQIDAALRRGL